MGRALGPRFLTGSDSFHNFSVPPTASTLSEQHGSFLLWQLSIVAFQISRS